MSKVKMRVLKAKIRGLEAEGRSIRLMISKAKGARRDELWCLKRQLGHYTRLHLLAYGLLRGKSYETLESRSLPLSTLAAEVTEVIHQNVFPWEQREWPFLRVYELFQRKKEVSASESAKDVPAVKTPPVAGLRFEPLPEKYRPKPLVKKSIGRLIIEKLGLS